MLSPGLQRRMPPPGFDAKFVDVPDPIVLITEEVWAPRQVDLCLRSYAPSCVIHTTAGNVTWSARRRWLTTRTPPCAPFRIAASIMSADRAGSSRGYEFPLGAKPHRIARDEPLPVNVCTQVRPGAGGKCADRDSFHPFLSRARCQLQPSLCRRWTRHLAERLDFADAGRHTS